MTLRRFACSREGWCRDSKVGIDLSGKKTRKVRETFCGCEAFIRINLVEDCNTWMVRALHVVHNHSMITSTEHRYLRINYVIPP